MPSNSSQKINTAITETFLEAVLGDHWETEPLIIQTYDDNADRVSQDKKNANAAGKKYRSARTATLCGTWAEIQKRAVLLAEEGCCIAWTVQKFENKRRDTPEFFRGIRFLPLDFDDENKPLPDFPLTPHAIAESSPGKFHVYFKATIPRGAFRDIMECLIETYGADPNAKDVCRVLRLPGFPNQKINSSKGISNGDKPHIVSLVSYHDDPPYSEAEIMKAFDVAQWKKEKAAPKEKKKKNSYSKILPSSTPQDLQEISQALEVIPSDERQTWLTVGMALSSMKRPEARTLWDDWSRSSQKFNETDQEMAWDSFRENKERVSDPSERVGIGTLFFIAGKFGYVKKKKDLVDGWHNDLIRNKDGNPTENMSNYMLLLSNHADWKGKFWWDEVCQIPMLEEIPFSDDILANIALWMGVKEKIPVRSLRLLEKCAYAVSGYIRRDPIKEWIGSLPQWDKIARLENWLINVAGIEDTELSRLKSRLMIESLIARGLDPGCILRFVHILEGAEGTGKTKLIRAMGSEWYIDFSINTDNKEAKIIIRGAWVAEMAELASMRKSEVDKMKSFVSDVRDSLVPKFSNNMVSHPRRTVFVGSTNDSNYLKGQSGDTRYIPVVTGENKINVELFLEMKDQIFAEALCHYQGNKRDWWVIPPHLLKELEEERKGKREFNPYEDELAAWLEGRDETTFAEIAQYFLEIRTPEGWKDKSLQMQVAQALKRCDWEKTDVKREGKTVRVWVRRCHE